MKRKIKIISLLVFITSVLVGTTLYLTQYNSPKNSMISCTARLVTFRESERMDLMVDFQIQTQSKTGVIAAIGTVRIDGSLQGRIYRKIAFSYEKEDSFYRFRSTNITIASDEHISDELLKMSLPQFFITTGSIINYSVYREGKRGYVFTVGKIPRFFCER
ncbi:hypothetical protein [Citrobacter amalonaticus]|uniref:hypothetical protein n=1 Tax=Citrobacter amalonaticus TaxID=35703 RepID=UPI001A25D4D1|nr:hypothetical protein [Citrobacter amalonaticus]HDQ2813313.1 hypothetical protein [Citrobacter amalonaticus]